MKEQLELLPGYLAAHLGLTLVALALGVIVSVPLGVLVTRMRRFEGAVMGTASIIQTIPGLALLAFMVPALDAVGLKSIGFLPALIALFLYSLLPVLRNTVAGLSGIDPAVLEAARGVGMTPTEQLWRVEMPLALPVIVAGIRTAAVWTVGTATLSTPVGATSLGAYIFGGLQMRNYTAVLVGCVASALLALLLDGLVRGLAVGIERRNRRFVTLSLAGFAALAIFAAVPVVKDALSQQAEPITIGAKPFTESYVLSEVVAEKISRDTGLPTRTLSSLGSTVVFDGLKANQIDAYVDYSGTLWMAILGHDITGMDRATMLRETERELRDRYGIVVAATLGFENTFAFAVRRADAEQFGLRKLSDLATFRGRFRLAAIYEFYERPEWRSFQQLYGNGLFKERLTMEMSLFYEAIKAKQIDVISTNSTDGRIAVYDLVVLEDDRHAIPPYDAMILVSSKLSREHPEAVSALRSLDKAIDAERMQRMNKEVDQDKRVPKDVAKEFLKTLHTRNAP